jgi:hypothetical protein
MRTCKQAQRPRMSAEDGHERNATVCNKTMAGRSMTRQGQKQGAARQKWGPKQYGVAGEPNAVQHANNTTGGEDA